MKSNFKFTAVAAAAFLIGFATPGLAATPQAEAKVALAAPSIKLEAGPGSTATFEAVGKPALMKIQGKGATVTGSVDVSAANVKGSFDLSLDQFTTGIETRDKHMKEKYLETQKFPKATLNIESVTLPSGWKPGNELKDAAFKGQLVLKEVSKPIEGKVSVGTGDMPAKANFVLKISDYPGMGVPAYMGITVADAVTVQVEIPKFVRKP